LEKQKDSNIRTNEVLFNQSRRTEGGIVSKKQLKKKTAAVGGGGGGWFRKLYVLPISGPTRKGREG